jgi:hypothetical protein
MLEKATTRATAARRRLAAALSGVRMGTEPPAGRRQPRVLFVNDLWGYGTVTIAMAVAEEMEGRAIRIFAGMGPGFELARRSPFDGLVAVDTMATPTPPDLERELSACQAVVSVMNRRVARAAVRRGLPCVYVDCLLWMYGAPPDLPPDVHYFQESFPGVDEAVERIRQRLPRAEQVGPLLTRSPGARSPEAGTVLVNYGGLSCSLAEPAILASYADTMTQCVVAALRDWHGRIVVGAGLHVLDRMDRRTLDGLRPGLELADLGHDAYLAELRRSRLLITSAGMHALFEAFDLGIPCLCLPSQNLSGMLALTVLERHGAARSLDWGRLYGLGDLDPADEAAAISRISGGIARFSQDAGARRRLVRQLRGDLDDRRLRDLQRRQARFYAELGEPGAPHIAARVLELLGDASGNTLPKGA